MALLTADSFNRADTTTGLGTTDGSGSLDPLTWTNGESIVRIHLNRAEPFGGIGGSTPNPVGLGVGDNIAYLDLLTADVDITDTFFQLQFGTGGGVGQSVGLMFRYSDIHNYWVWLSAGTSLSTAQSGLFKLVAGSWTQLGSFHAGANNGDGMRVHCSGSTISCYRNGSLLETQTDTFNSTATKHGLRFDSGGDIDDWSVGAVLAAGSGWYISGG